MYAFDQISDTIPVTYIENDSTFQEKFKSKILRILLEIRTKTTDAAPGNGYNVVMV